jgi:acetoacetyl-CoA synthetase
MELGRAISMDTFLADPSLHGLVAAARQAVSSSQTPTLVPLAEGSPQLPPFFFIHDAWGDVDVYRVAARQLRNTGPVFGVRGELSAEDGTYLSIEEIAAAAVMEIERATPGGPLRLGGHSFGGLVAFEVARQLTDRGRTVDLLVLFDVLPPSASLGAVERRVARVTRQLAAITPGLRTNRLRDVLKYRLRPETLPTDDQAFNRSSGAYDGYVWGRYTGRVMYFRASVRVPITLNMINSWRRVIPQLTVIDSPGAHHHLFAEQHVDELANRLSEALASVPGLLR